MGKLHKYFINTLEHMKHVRLLLTLLSFPGGCASERHTSSLFRFLFLPIPWGVNSLGPLCVVCPWYVVHLALRWAWTLFFIFYWSIIDLQCHVSFSTVIRFYIYIYIHTHTHTHIYIHIYIYIYIYIYIHTHTYTYIYMYICFFRFFSLIGYYKYCV